MALVYVSSFKGLTSEVFLHDRRHFGEQGKSYCHHCGMFRRMIYRSTSNGEKSFNIQMFQQITILGPGLLGASLAMAVKARGLSQRVVVWSRRAETRGESAKQAWCDAVFETPEAAVGDSDLVVICTPVETIAPLLATIQAHLSATALVTDVGSTKHHICKEAQHLLQTGAKFIGSHPMAGSEQTGMAHARADLFENAACILTPTDDSAGEATARLQAFWRGLGMQTSVMPPEQHDEAVAHISHLPHLLTSALCGYLSKKDEAWRHLAGSGLRDCTRIAAGDPDLWQQILKQNREEVLHAIDGYEAVLQDFKATLAEAPPAELQRLLVRGKKYRDHLNP
jgi:cyclohexadieny/prephenate dehydrogenase